jgi:hypothetical protein
MESPSRIERVTRPNYQKRPAVTNGFGALFGPYLLSWRLCPVDVGEKRGEAEWDL